MICGYVMHFPWPTVTETSAAINHIWPEFIFRIAILWPHGKWVIELWQSGYLVTVQGISRMIFLTESFRTSCWCHLVASFGCMQKKMSLKSKSWTTKYLDSILFNSFVKEWLTKRTGIHGSHIDSTLGFTYSLSKSTVFPLASRGWAACFVNQGDHWSQKAE